jgi:hypothetical protein
MGRPSGLGSEAIPNDSKNASRAWPVVLVVIRLCHNSHRNGKKMKAIICSTLLVCAVGCGAEDSPAYHRSFNITLERASLSDADIEMTLEAIVEWQAFGIELNVVIGKCDDDTIHKGGEVCVKEMSSKELASYDAQFNENVIDLTKAQEGAVVYLNSNTTVQQAAHELGHSIGISYHTGAGTVMCKDTGCAAHYVTGADYQSYLNTRE